MFKKLMLAAVLATPSLALAEAYLTVGVAAGTVDMSHIEDAYGAGAQTTTDDEVRRAVIGAGINVNRYLGFEATYMTKSDATVKDSTDLDSFEHQGLQLAIIGRAPLGAQFNVFGKLSANYMDTRYEYSVLGTKVYSEDDKATHLGVGLGVQYRINDAVGVSLAAERIMMDGVIDESFLTEPGDIDLDQATLSVDFHF